MRGPGIPVSPPMESENISALIEKYGHKLTEHRRELLKGVVDQRIRLSYSRISRIPTISAP
jgi:hypothetical protein